MDDFKNNWWKWLIAVVIFGALLTYCNTENVETKRLRKESGDAFDAKKKEEKRRYQNGAYVEKEKKIGAGETIKTVVMPGEHGEISDTRCFIYTNTELKQATFLCPIATQDDIRLVNDR